MVPIAILLAKGCPVVDMANSMTVPERKAGRIDRNASDLIVSFKHASFKNHTRTTRFATDNAIAIYTTEYCNMAIVSTALRPNVQMARDKTSLVIPFANSACVNGIAKAALNGGRVTDICASNIICAESCRGNYCLAS